MVNEMRKFPINTKRSVGQFGLNVMKDDISLKKEKQKETIDMYDKQYK